MPEISRFRGIVIRMYFRDHVPPHFHAEYGENEITVEIETGMIEGKFPRRRSVRRARLARLASGRVGCELAVGQSGTAAK